MTISIILPSFNYSWCIGQAIESVVNQSYQDWELIIVDDCSSDDSIDVIKRYIDNKPKKIRLLSNPKNIGLAKTYERGVNHSVGEYIAFIESDDIWSQDKLKTQIATMERNPSVVLSYTDIELFGTKNDYFMKRAAEIERYKISFKIAEGPADFTKIICDRTPILTLSSVMLRRTALCGIDFSDRYKAWFDWWLYAQLTTKGEFFFMPEKLTTWRIHEKSYNSVYRKEIQDYHEFLKMQAYIKEYLKI